MAACLSRPISWSMAAMLRVSVAVVGRARLRSTPTAMLTVRKELHFSCLDACLWFCSHRYGTPLRRPSSRRSSAINLLQMEGMHCRVCCRSCTGRLVLYEREADYGEIPFTCLYHL